MTPEQEQEVLRIAQEIWPRTDERDWVRDFSKELEFARRLLAERERAEPVALICAWNENKCGDDECEAYRLKAAIAVLTGGITHKENADKLYAAPAAPSQDAQDAKRDDKTAGLCEKYHVKRLHDPVGKHAGCEYFVLDLVHDKFAPAALFAYADHCETEFPYLARDLRKKALALMDDAALRGKEEGHG